MGKRGVGANSLLVLALAGGILAGCAVEGSPTVPPTAPTSSHPVSEPPSTTPSEPEQFSQVGFLQPTEYGGEELLVRGQILLQITSGELWTNELNGERLAGGAWEEMGRGRAVLINDDGTDAVLATYAELHPAEGVKSAWCERRLVAMDKMLELRWTAELPVVEVDVDYCNLPELTVTNNGRFVAIPDKGLFLDVGSGRLHEVSGSPRPVGNLLALFDKKSLAWSEPGDLTILEPETGRQFVVSDDNVTLAYRTVADNAGLGWLSADDAILNRVADFDEPDNEFLYQLNVREGVLETMMPLTGVQAEQASDLYIAVESSTRTVLVVGSYPRQVQAYSVDSGQPTWRLDDAWLCAVSNRAVVVNVNDQLASLDPVTGEQLAYSASINQCDVVLGDHLYITDYTTDFYPERPVYRILP